MKFSLMPTATNGFCACSVCGYVGPGEVGDSAFTGSDMNSDHLHAMHRFWIRLRKAFGEDLVTYESLVQREEALPVILERMSWLSCQIMHRCGGDFDGMALDKDVLKLVDLCSELMLLKFNQSVRVNDYATWLPSVNLEVYSMLLWSTPLFRYSLSRYIHPKLVMYLAEPYQTDYCFKLGLDMGKPEELALDPSLDQSLDRDWVVEVLVGRCYEPFGLAQVDFASKVTDEVCRVELLKCCSVKASVESIVSESVQGPTRMGRPRNAPVDVGGTAEVSEETESDMECEGSCCGCSYSAEDVVLDDVSEDAEDTMSAGVPEGGAADVKAGRVSDAVLYKIPVGAAGILSEYVVERRAVLPPWVGAGTVGALMVPRRVVAKPVTPSVVSVFLG